MVKLDRLDVIEIKRLLKFYNMTHQQIADKFGVSRGHITKIKNEKRWKNDYREENKKD
jgi:transcriptional regulator with XRE-family HTH domain